MEQKQIDMAEIKKLHHGQSYIVPKSDYGIAEVWMINYVYFLFSIPEFGGQPTFEKVFKKGAEDEMIQLIYSWS